MIRISVVIITYNEEKNIEKCLRSVEDIADEIIVTDSFSTDRTKEICSQFNVKFFQNVFDNFAAQKNLAVSYASNDYILSLDADEQLSDELKNSIRAIDSNSPADAYKFNRLNFFCGKAIRHSNWYPDVKLRFWNKRKGKWAGDIHETVHMDTDAKTEFLKGDLLHNSFHSIEEHLTQINKFSGMKARVMYKKRKRTNIFMIIFKPQIKFLQQYIFRLGFLDGFYGFVISKNSAYSEFLKHIKLRDLYRNE